MNDQPLKTDETPDPLERLLRESATHIPDAGFTQQVLLALPMRRRPDFLRWSLLGGALAVGIVVFLVRAPFVEAALLEFLRHARHGEWVSLLSLGPVVLGLGALLWGVVSIALDEG